MSDEKQPPIEEIELGAAMRELSSLKPQEGKAAMMNQVDGAVERVLKILAEGDPDALQKGTYLTQIRFVLTIMEQCKEFRDAQFTLLVRRRVEEIMLGLENLPKRSKELKEKKKQDALDAKNKVEQSNESDETAPNAKKKKKKPAKPKEPEFPYELAEKISIQSVVRHFDAKLDCLRSTHIHGRHSTEDIGIAPHFLYTVEFSVLIEDAIKALFVDSRDILSRRLYNETDPTADEEKIRSVLRDKQRALMDVVDSGFAGWGSSQREAEKAAKTASAPASKKSAPVKKEKKGGLFSKLLGKDKKEAPVAAKKPVKKEKEAWEKVLDGWKEQEAKGIIFFPRTFNFGMLAYLSGLHEKIFSSEVDRINQIAEQAQGGSSSKGAVARGLEQTFKNNDQTFFELVILNLLYTKNKIGLDEVQGACMGQKLDEYRLPLSVPEMGRRPNAYAIYLIKILGEKCEPRVLETCLKCFFESLLILHLIKYEKDFKNAATYIESKKDTLPKPFQGIIDGVLGLMDRVNFSRQQARETGEDTQRNTNDNIEHTIDKFMTAYKGMYEKFNKAK